MRLKKLEAAGGPVVLRLVEHMLQRDAAQRKTVQVSSYGALAGIAVGISSDRSG